MAVKCLLIAVVALFAASCSAGVVPAAYVAPYATSYNAHFVNHAVAAPIVAHSAPLVAHSAPVVAHSAPLVAAPAAVAYSSPYVHAAAYPAYSAYSSPYILGK